ncbi:2-hydroxyacyl-CoA dehydratase [Dehalogenimonas sp. THU2]|uniref:2-hydroxyacyl-CoA dehydratase family protein n=1 Tax=Dehalogenimonas sp. THU2 TaxID=3151121 RepID=UPI003218B67E
MKRIGITTTVPVEVVLAAGAVPIDLNNLFISDPDPASLITIAEKAGFPLNTCAWIKGIYGATLKYGIANVICVTGGDCSNTLMLMEVLRHKGVRTIPFAYPPIPDCNQVTTAIDRLATDLGVTRQAAEQVRKELLPTRKLTAELDRFTWAENRISGKENHFWLVSASDFNSDVGAFTDQLGAVIQKAAIRDPYPADEIRLGLIGVPPVYASQLYPFLEGYGGRVVYNEVQRQFAMPYDVADLGEQYTRYTYPYATEQRIEDIKTATTQRNLDGIIHYVQSFCHRAIGDILIRFELGVPILTIEGNMDFGLSQHLKTRLEAFLDMLSLKRTATR